MSNKNGCRHQTDRQTETGDYFCRTRLKYFLRLRSGNKNVKVARWTRLQYFLTLRSGSKILETKTNTHRSLTIIGEEYLAKYGRMEGVTNGYWNT